MSTWLTPTLVSDFKWNYKRLYCVFKWKIMMFSWQCSPTLRKIPSNEKQLIVGSESSEADALIEVKAIGSGTAALMLKYRAPVWSLALKTRKKRKMQKILRRIMWRFAREREERETALSRKINYSLTNKKLNLQLHIIKNYKAI